MYELTRLAEGYTCLSLVNMRLAIFPIFIIGIIIMMAIKVGKTQRDKELGRKVAADLSRYARMRSRIVHRIRMGIRLMRESALKPDAHLLVGLLALCKSVWALYSDEPLHECDVDHEE